MFYMGPYWVFNKKNCNYLAPMCAINPHSMYKNLCVTSASWVICQFEHCVHDPINAPRMKLNPYIYIL